MNKPIIDIDSITMKYGKITAVDDVSLSLQSNRVIGLCGPNGAGKTTLIKMIVGLINGFNGEILIDGKRVGKRTKSIVSYQPDVFTLDNNLTGKKAITQYTQLFDDFNQGRFMELSEKLKVPLDIRVKNMSKGMKEKFQLILTLSRDAKVYIFDEPLAAVDPATRDSIVDTIIRYYTKDAVLLISTHIIQDIEVILDEVIFINEGSIVLHENCDKLRTDRMMSIDQIFREEFKW